MLNKQFADFVIQSIITFGTPRPMFFIEYKLIILIHRTHEWNGQIFVQEYRLILFPLGSVVVFGNFPPWFEFNLTMSIILACIQ